MDHKTILSSVQTVGVSSTGSSQASSAVTILSTLQANERQDSEDSQEFGRAQLPDPSWSQILLRNIQSTVTKRSSPPANERRDSEDSQEVGWEQQPCPSWSSISLSSDSLSSDTRSQKHFTPSVGRRRQTVTANVNKQKPMTIRSDLNFEDIMDSTTTHISSTEAEIYSADKAKADWLATNNVKDEYQSDNDCIIFREASYKRTKDQEWLQGDHVNKKKWIQQRDHLQSTANSIAHSDDSQGIKLNSDKPLSPTLQSQSDGDKYRFKLTTTHLSPSEFQRQRQISIAEDEAQQYVFNEDPDFPSDDDDDEECPAGIPYEDWKIHPWNSSSNDERWNRVDNEWSTGKEEEEGEEVAIPPNNGQSSIISKQQHRGGG